MGIGRYLLAICGVFILTELSAATAQAGTISYDFTSPMGVLGNSQGYNVNGVTITAYGFASGLAANLYGKNSGADETGLGLANDYSGDHEISHGNFVQLDISQFLAKGYNTASIFVNSVQAGESWDLFASNTLGQLGTLEISNSLVADHAVDISSLLHFKYVSLTAHYAGIQDDILLGLVTASSGASIPENGSTAMLLVVAVCGLCFLHKKLS